MSIFLFLFHILIGVMTTTEPRTGCIILNYARYNE